MIGQTISHYRILEKLGEGGMGVVYKAEDTKLKRTVALKFLPPELTRDRSAKTRFIHEAQAASALQHHNICTIHEIDETKDGRLFIAMDCYEGETLKDKIARGQLPVEEALSIAMQVAEGLSEAHQAGMVHRDIKPGNIMVTAKGVVKILDFGLAKLAGVTRLTKTGTTVGTISYMSPEQARGEEVDARSDIFSLGAVLYEMLTGEVPFPGDHEAAVLYGIIHGEPKPITSFRSNVPMELERIVKRAMQKGCNERYERGDDLLVALRLLRKDIESGIPKYRPSKSAITSRKQTYLYVGIAVLIMMACTYVVFRNNVPEVNANLNVRALEVSLKDISSPGLSSDGNWVAFPAIGTVPGIYFMNSSGGEPRRITSDTLGVGWHADVSPDGSQIVYDWLTPQANRFSVFTVSSLGGMSRRVAEIGLGPKWHPDGERIGYILGAGDQFPSKSGKLEFWSVRPDGSDNRLEFVDGAGIVLGSAGFAWSPDGKSIAWIRGYPEWYKEVIIHNLKSGAERQLTFDKKGIDDVCWTGNDQIVFSSNKNGNMNLWTVPAAGGEAVQVTKGTGSDIGIKTSADGRELVYLQQQPVAHLWIANKDGKNARQITFDNRLLEDPSLSPDGKHVAFVIRDVDFQNLGKSGGWHVHIMDRDGSNRRQLTYSAEFAACPVWSPDGRQIAYSSRTSPIDSSKIYLIEVSRPDTRKPISYGLMVQWLSRDRVVVFRQTSSSLVSLDGTEPQRVYEDSTWALPILGDRYILFYDLRKHREGWWIIAAGPTIGDLGRKPKRICSTDYQILLAPSGTHLFCVASEVGSSKVELCRISLPHGNKERLLEGEYPSIPLQSGAGLCSNVQMSYDGKEIIYSQVGQTGKLVMIDNLFR